MLSRALSDFLWDKIMVMDARYIYNYSKIMEDESYRDTDDFRYDMVQCHIDMLWNHIFVGFFGWFLDKSVKDLYEHTCKDNKFYEAVEGK